MPPRPQLCSIALIAVNVSVVPLHGDPSDDHHGCGRSFFKNAPPDFHNWALQSGAVSKGKRYGVGRIFALANESTFGNYFEFIEMKELVATNSLFRTIPSIRLNVDF